MDTLWIVHYHNSQKWIQQSWCGILLGTGLQQNTKHFTWMTYFMSQGKNLYQSPHKTEPLVVMSFDAKRNTLNRRIWQTSTQMTICIPTVTWSLWSCKRLQVIIHVCLNEWTIHLHTAILHHHHSVTAVVVIQCSICISRTICLQWFGTMFYTRNNQ